MFRKNRRIILFLLSITILVIAAVVVYRLSHFRSPSRPPDLEPLPPIWNNLPSSIPAKPLSQQHSQICSHLYQYFCQNDGETLDPTGSVKPDLDGEKEVLQIYKKLIRQHRHWSAEQIDNELVTKIFDLRSRARIQSAFHWVERRMEKLIDHQSSHVFTSQEKHQIKSRLHHTLLQLPPPASTYADEPDLFLKNEIYYERLEDGQMRLRVGGAYVVTTTSWFNLVFTMAHELAHAIDPCEIRSAHLSFPAYDHLTACFLSNHLIALGKNRSECGANDQLSETFADWIAAQITADALASFSVEFNNLQILSAAQNSIRDLCDQDDMSFNLEFHPSPEIRIERIFGRNPLIRRVLGCGPVTDPPPYCTFESVFPKKSA